MNSLVNRIRNANGNIVRHGIYSYMVNMSGQIIRCRTDRVGMVAIDYTGSMVDWWEITPW